MAGAVLGGLDRTADPCSDFYQYACGGWMKSNPLPEGKSRWGTFSDLWEQNMLVMKHLLGKSPSSQVNLLGGGQSRLLLGRRERGRTSRPPHWCCCCWGAHTREVICALVLFAWSCREHISDGPEPG